MSKFFSSSEHKLPIRKAPTKLMPTEGELIRMSSEATLQRTAIIQPWSPSDSRVGLLLVVKMEVPTRLLNWTIYLDAEPSSMLWTGKDCSLSRVIHALEDIRCNLASTYPVDADATEVKVASIQIGQLLLRSGAINHQTLESALLLQKTKSLRGRRLGEILVMTASLVPSLIEMAAAVQTLLQKSRVTEARAYELLKAAREQKLCAKTFVANVET